MRERRATWMTLAVAAAFVSALPALGQTPAPHDTAIVREGEGPRRTQLDQMELSPFPADAWGKLSDWKNGEAPTEASTKGKVVLICTYSDWYAPAKRGFALAKRLAETYAKDGLVVVAAHHQQGWDSAAKPAAPAGATLLIAHDAESKFRDALKVDQDPDFYLIDRAGQLRLADIVTESVEEACKTLVGETAEDAASTRRRLADAARGRDLDQRRIDALRDQVDLTQVPELPFTEPTPDEYKKANWPPMPKDPNNYQDKNARIEPKPISLPDANWFPAKPELKGRAVLIYLWHPDILDSYREIMKQADLFQRQHGRDLVVVGVLTPFDSSINNQQMTDQQRDPEKLLKKLKEIAGSRHFDHYLTIDTSNAIFETLKNQNSQIPWPFYVVVSSDKMARCWPIFDQQRQGAIAGMNPLAALDRILVVDPGIKARRAAEAEWIRTHQK